MFTGTYLFRPNKRVPSGKPLRHLNLLRASLILLLCFEQGSDIIFLDPLLDVAHISHYFHSFWNKELTAKGTSERLFLFDRSSVSHFTSYLCIFLSLFSENEKPGIMAAIWTDKILVMLIGNIIIELHKLDTFLSKLHPKILYSFWNPCQTSHLLAKAVSSLVNSSISLWER